MSEFRKIKALPMRGVTPAAAVGVEPRFEWIAPEMLFVEQAYQRGLAEHSMTMIRRIVGAWNWARIKPPVCVNVGGKLVVIDGQHTAIAAASHGGIPKIPVMIVQADTVKDRAAAFISQNRDRLALTAMHMHFAAVAAGDEIAVAAAEACAKAGVTVIRFGRGSRGVYKVGETFAVGVIQRIVKKVGVHHCARALKVLIDAKRAPLPANEIAAVAVLLFEPEWKEKKVDLFDLATVIRSKSVAEWKAVSAGLASKGTPTRIALATALYRALKHG